MAYLFFMKYKKLKFIHFLIIAIALNFRPNYLFLLPIFILDDGFINSIKLLIKHFLSFLTVGYLSFLGVNYMYKDYTFENILFAINRYRVASQKEMDLIIHCIEYFSKWLILLMHTLFNLLFFHCSITNFDIFLFFNKS